MSNLVAIVGRPNVGKSTLFNRLIESRQAIVDATSGTTRDHHYGKCDWCGKEFSVIDTGGYVEDSEDIFEEEINWLGIQQLSRIWMRIPSILAIVKAPTVKSNPFPAPAGWPV